MQEYRIWKHSHQDKGMLIPENKIEEAVYSCEQVMIVRNVDISMIDELNEKMTAWRKSDEGYMIYHVQALQEWFEEVAGIEAADVEGTDVIADPEEVVAYSDGLFGNLAEFETVPVYRWYDGRNWKIEIADEDVTETRLVITDDYVDLDEWDGRNHVTGGIGLHARVYRVLKLDGEEVADTFLVNEWSQWQGDHATGEVLTLDELPDVLRELNRDPAVYMPQVEALKNE